MKKIKKIMQKIFASTILFLGTMNIAHAQLTKPKPHGLVETESFSGVIETVIQWLLTFLGSLALLFIVYAGIMYITSAGDSSKAEKAKDILVYAVTGLVIALLGYVIVLIVGDVLSASNTRNLDWLPNNF